MAIAHPATDGLTGRQQEVLRLIADGRTNGEIAGALGITIDGAKWHVREILTRLNVESREEAADIWRADHGLRRRLWASASAVVALPLRWLAAGAVAAAAAIAAAVFALVAIGSEEAPEATSPQETASATTATPSAPASPSIAAAGSITDSDVDLALAMERNGRHLFPEAATAGRIILRADAQVTYAPGEVVTQGGKHDQQFLLWDPNAGTFDTLWSEVGDRTEQVLGIDGDWAVTLLYTINSHVRWTVRLHNLATGEPRDVASQPPGGINDYDLFEVPVVAAGRVLMLTESPDGAGGHNEEIREFDLATGEWRTLRTAPYVPGAAPPFAGLTGGGDLVAWHDATAPDGMVVHEIASGKEFPVQTGPVSECHLSGDGLDLVCAGPRPNAFNDVRYFAVHLETGNVTEIGKDGNMLGYVVGGYATTVSNGSVSRSGLFLYDIEGRQAKAFAPANTSGRAQPALLNGWLYWADWSEDGEGNTEWAKSTLKFVRLP